MLAMEAGGADIIELGVPFTDPQADGPAIQETNVVRISIQSLPRQFHKIPSPRLLSKME
jgi:tryptophan synthase alpha subunit